MAKRGRWKVWFGRARALAWLGVGLVVFLLGATDSVALVWWASVYANAESGFATAEAADDGAVLERLDRIERMLREGQRGCDCRCTEPS